MEDDLLRYFPTKGGYVVGKSNRAKHPNIETTPHYNLKKTLTFSPLNPKKVSSQSSQGQIKSPIQSVDDLVRSNEVGVGNVVPIDDEVLFAYRYQGDESIDLDEVNL
ncbi:hypothetical protein MKW92_042818, partial [Papaver armeniacum]